MSRVFINDSTLTAIGNAIRQKSGSSGLLLPSNMAEAIASIPSGGGESGLPDNWVVGEFTPQSDLETYTVSHNHGSKPFLAICFTDIRNNTKKYGMQVSVAATQDDATYTHASLVNNYTGAMNAFATNYTAVSEMSESVVTFTARGGNYTYKTGVTYTYVLVFQE